jgi:hypothetical protein
VELSVKYIVKSLAVLWQHVFQAVVCVSSVVQGSAVGRSAIIRSLELGLGFYRGADKSLARPGRKQATATDDFEFHISYL